MAYRFFTQRPTARLLAGGSVLGGIGLAGSPANPRGNGGYSATEAEVQFETSFGYVKGGQQLIKPPKNWVGPLFQIRNDYPKILPYSGGEHTNSSETPILPGPDMPPPSADPVRDSPWLRVDFKTDPLTYCALIKEYCWEGNVNNGFVLQKNTIRDWYHAPWMHWNVNGREPLNGFTFERPTPPLELSKTQERFLQNWACGFYNATGASVFGKTWNNPNNPRWANVKFPLGTCVFKILMTDATDAEIPVLKGSPTMKAVIAEQPTKPNATGEKRNKEPSNLRLLQVDIAVRDDRAPIGWVFGTFMYDGSQKQRNGWDRIIPVGIMWGNDPELTPAKAKAGQKPKESWINPQADAIRKSLGGTRPSWGWNGRLNGPVDNFISACASCHSVSENSTKAPVKMFPDPDASDAEKMRWFRNIPAGQPFTPGEVSGDYSLQLMIGYSNYEYWRNSQKGIWYKTKLAVPFSQTRKEADAIESKRAPLRAGVPPTK